MKKNQTKTKKYEIDPFSSIPPVENDPYDPFAGIGSLNPLNQIISKDTIEDMSAECPQIILEHPAVVSEDISEDKIKDISAECLRSVQGYSADISSNKTTDITKDKTTDIIKNSSADKTKDITEYISADNSILLTKRESALYKILQPYGSGITTSKALCSLSGISKDYIIKLMCSLEKKGVIKKLQLNHQDKGYKFDIIPNINIIFPEDKILIKSLSEDKTGYKKIILSEDKTKDISTDNFYLYNSSSSIKNTTTTEFSETDIIEKILGHPEMEFWKEQGTTAKQILNGVQTTGTTLDNFIQSMKHYAHEKPASEKAPMAHMIGGIKRNGIWAKKPDYKSHEEKQAEIQAQIITDRAQELQRLKEIREKTAKIERDLEFEKFMADRDAELYQEIFQSLTDFEKKRVALGKDDAMRRAWEKKLEL